VVQHGNPRLAEKVMAIREDNQNLRDENIRLKERYAKLEKTTSKARSTLFADFELIPSAGCWRHKTSGEIACPRCQTGGILSYVARSNEHKEIAGENCSCHACGNRFIIK